MDFTHFNEEGRARMVDVSEKQESLRIGVAQGRIRMKPETVKKVRQGVMKKGDVLGVAQIAGIMGAKQTSQWIPMCHPLFLTGVNVSFRIEKETISIQAEVKTEGKTGVEMEALTAVSAAALTIYDMCKAVDKDMVIEEIFVVKKLGGKSGEYVREGCE